MKVTLNWLKDFVDIDVTTSALAEKLVAAGFEVEEIIEQSAGMKNVVLGKIVKLEKHFDSDHLQVCQIDIGKQEPVQIVTGAQNVSLGDLVPAALNNSTLPNGQTIKAGKLRGVESSGMLCSGEELKLSESEYVGASVNGIMLMNGEKFPLGTDINVVLGNDDTILDIGVTANRNDCNSILGIAREVATVLKKPLKMPNLSFKTLCKKKTSDFLTVNVQNATLCPRYMSCVVDNIVIQPSAEIIQKRLKAVGLRPINNIVDITNYVLIEIGQPMHAFDTEKLSQNVLNIRNAQNGEKIVALDAKEYELNDSMLTIADGEKPLAIAGVMGGIDSGISGSTKTIAFESAKFLRDNIRRTSRKLNLRSDSSFRFERGIDFDSQRLGMQRALSLISQYNYGEIACGMIDVLNADLSPKVINVSVSKINSILGIVVPTQIMLDILNSLQIKTTLQGEDTLVCEQPIFRDDIENANDLAEEIIRLYGYDYIVSTLMDKGKQTIGGKNAKQKNVDTLREIAVNNSFNEILTYSFVSPKCFDTLLLDKDDALRNCITILNPLGEDMSVMRTTLSYSMLATLSSNYLKGNKTARLFENARVYIPNENTAIQPTETEKIVFGAYGENETFYTLRNVVEQICYKFRLNATYSRAKINYLHAGRSAVLTIKDKEIGYIGEVHPSVLAKLDIKDRVYIAELDIDMLNKLANFAYEFKSIPKFPSIERDIAIVVDEEKDAENILQIVRKGGGNMLESAKIFDIYRSESLGKDKKSVAIKMTFRNAEKTLVEEEVNAKIERILTKLTSEIGAVLR
ncbi:MAG: phenylalanine--tRNA ligase subunit beta [Clostridia bacterium]